MDKNKEIEKMALVMSNGYCQRKCSKCPDKPICADYEDAERLFNEGYGDKKQAAKEALNKLKEKAAAIKGKNQDIYLYKFLYLTSDCEINNLIQSLYGEDDQNGSRKRN